MPHRLLRVCAPILLTILVSCAGNSQPAVDNSVLTQQLQELEALPLPAGVAEADWLDLKRAFASVLRQQGGKQASAPPVSIRAASPLSFATPTTTLTWYYASPGDYNQDGLVTISDLTPLGAHLNESNGGVPWPDSSVQAAIDGDSNGEINISDLTPLGANLGAHVTGYNVYVSQDHNTDYPLDNSADSTIDPLATVAFSEAIGEKTTERLHFTHVAPAHVANDTYWVRPSEGAEEGTASNRAPIEIALTLDNDGEVLGAPALVVLSAFLTTGSGANSWEWDLDGNGSFELVIDGFWLGSLFKLYDTPGTRNIGVRCRDISGRVLATKTTPLTIEDAPGRWSVQTVPGSIQPDDPIGNHIGHIDLLDVDGHAAVGWVAQPNGESVPTPTLYYQYSTDGLGEDWAAAQVIDAGGEAVGWWGLGLVNGLPAAAYGYDPATVEGYGTYYKQAGDVAGTDWGLGRSFIEGAVGTASADVFDAGGPLVVFTGYWSRNLIIATPGASFADPWSLDDRGLISSDEAGTETIMLGGIPAVAWIQAIDSNTREVRYWLLDGVAAPQTVDTITGEFASAGVDIVAVDGLPAVLYRESATISYRRATDVAGTAWGPAVEFISDKGVYGASGDQNDLAVINGKPAIAFPGSVTALFYCEATDTLGAAWGEPEYVLSTINPEPVLKEVNGHATIAQQTFWDTRTPLPEQVVLAVKQ
jgi:hypothetical protein